MNHQVDATIEVYSGGVFLTGGGEGSEERYITYLERPTTPAIREEDAKELEAKTAAFLQLHKELSDLADRILTYRPYD